MAKMSDSELKAILAAEHADAMSSMHASKLSSEREQASNYYNGEMPDMPSIEGRSSAVSSDTQDTVEGLMPSLMEIFAASDDVVGFEPVGQEDEQAAQQETDYVNHVFMQQNPGFLVMHNFVKDSLLHKMSIVKVHWVEEEKEERETYYGLDEAQFAMLASDSEVEIIEHTERMMDEEPAEMEDASGGVY